ncbi:hypothetical protein [Saccharomonospora viridis]|uniref:hypothetical protein n=1 Tax=Saccharomonospora viridis TaxID=1852 RepID=UPI0024092960|nr:hypothetical protein [Saccharomonospora viridis]
MEPMAYAEPGGIASADEYNKVVDNVNEMSRGTLTRRYRATSQKIPNVTWTKVAFDTLVSPSPHVVVNAAGDTFTIVTPGSYAFSASARYDTNSTGFRHLVLGDASQPGTRYTGDSKEAIAENVTLEASTERNFAAGDKICAWTRQNSGADRNLVPAGEVINFTIRYCGES